MKAVYARSYLELRDKYLKAWGIRKDGSIWRGWLDL